MIFSLTASSRPEPLSGSYTDEMLKRVQHDNGVGSA